MKKQTLQEKYVRKNLSFENIQFYEISILLKFDFVKIHIWFPMKVHQS